MHLPGGGQEAGSEAEGRADIPRRDAGLGGRGGGYVILTFILSLNSSATLTCHSHPPVASVRRLPGRHVIVSSQLHAPAGPELHPASQRLHGSRLGAAQPAAVPRRRARRHAVGQQRQRQPAHAGGGAARAQARARCQGDAQERDRGSLGREDARGEEARKE